MRRHLYDARRSSAWTIHLKPGDGCINTSLTVGFALRWSQGHFTVWVGPEAGWPQVVQVRVLPWPEIPDFPWHAAAGCIA